MILIAPDKFKGTFTAEEICRMVCKRLRDSGIVERICCRPLSDGGEGVASVFMPEGKKISEGVYEHNGHRLVVTSEIIGFSAFSGRNIPLMHRSSVNLGHAIVPGIPTTVAVGGTAVSDAGAGFLQGLGVKFYNGSGDEITEPLCPDTLKNVMSADLSALNQYHLCGIIDVKAGLTEGSLTALDFAPQKALPGENIAGLAECLRHFQRVLGGKSQWDGAGGGVGYALASVCGARCYSGAEAAVMSLDIDWDKVQLVITGEGRVDAQTVRGGKLVDAISREASLRKIPTLILYGAADDTNLYPLMAQINSPWEKIVSSFLV